MKLKEKLAPIYAKLEFYKEQFQHLSNTLGSVIGNLADVKREVSEQHTKYAKLEQQQLHLFEIHSAYEQQFNVLFEDVYGERILQRLTHAWEAIHQLEQLADSFGDDKANDRRIRKLQEEWAEYKESLAVSKRVDWRFFNTVVPLTAHIHEYSGEKVPGRPVPPSEWEQFKAEWNAIDPKYFEMLSDDYPKPEK